MKTKTTGITATDAMKARMESKLQKLEKYPFFEEDTTAHVRVKVHQSTKKVEITIPTRKPTKIQILRAEAESDDFYTAFDKAVDKITGQIRKLKTRLEKRHKMAFSETISTPVEEENVIKLKHLQLENMEIEDAIISMELSDHDFFIFRDAESGAISVLYKRKNGEYGLISISD